MPTYTGEIKCISVDGDDSDGSDDGNDDDDDNDNTDDQTCGPIEEEVEIAETVVVNCDGM